MFLLRTFSVPAPGAMALNKIKQKVPLSRSFILVRERTIEKKKKMTKINSVPNGHKCQGKTKQAGQWHMNDLLEWRLLKF